MARTRGADQAEAATAAAAAAVAAAVEAAAAAIEPEPLETDPVADAATDSAVHAAASAAVEAITVSAQRESAIAAASSGKKEAVVMKVLPAIAVPEQEPDPNAPSDRDVLAVADDPVSEKHLGNMVFDDLIRMHYLLWKKQQEEINNDSEGTTETVLPTTESEVEDIASRITTLILHGKKYDLSGLKDVPKPFLKGAGRFFEPLANGGWKLLEEDAAKSYVAQTILKYFPKFAAEPQNEDVKVCIDDIFASKKEVKPADEISAAPRPCDVLFLPSEYPWEENMAYEHQVGNKKLLSTAAQNVTPDAVQSSQRIDAAAKIMAAKVEVAAYNEVVQQNPRFVIQTTQSDAQNTWDEMTMEDLAEFAVAFVFDVYLEKQMHALSPNVPVSVQMASFAAETAQPSDIPIENPTTHDVLFGRGGMTNGHSGNRRFRDIIALHRPDYIKAAKMDKPNVARRIVKAIRDGNPPGRFLKKGEDGMWRDVGDKVASEKTSQGLRERSNAEKRHRTALREALRIRKEDMAEGEEGARKVGEGDFDDIIPLSLNMKDKNKDSKGKRGKKPAAKEEPPTESLPPNAVDEEGNILVTDHDILCGRGGLTNHHRGNKRFRDIVALHRPDYVRAPKVQKPSVARVIVRAIRNGDPPGRFLKKDDKTGKWIDIGDKKAAEKTSQALREKTNEEKHGGKPPAVPPGFTSPTMILPTAVAVVDSQAKEEPMTTEEPIKEEEMGVLNV